MTRIIVLIKTSLAIGISNIIRVGLYHLGLKTRFSSATRITSNIAEGPFFDSFRNRTNASIAGGRPGELLAFGFHPISFNNSLPLWRKSCLRADASEVPLVSWWEIEDFDATVGDIKEVWELSRFNWLPRWAWQAQQGDHFAAARACCWLEDWMRDNPPHLGPNWKCGQEASIRVIHLAATALILEEREEPLPELLQLISTHLQRIAPTIGYAVAQDNNHGTSEAAALFIGGSWLAIAKHPNGKKWEKQGRKWLENRARKLIETDGSFSQYSVVYHRLMLDTLSFAELWRDRLKLPRFSDTFYSRAAAATEWLAHFVDPQSGNAPNLGANDGAHILNATNAEYRDFRPSLQLASNLLLGRCILPPGPWDNQLSVFKIKPLPHQPPELGPRLLDQGGFAILQNRRAKVFLRYPRFRFRPSQADALHLDLWLGDLNLIRDGGTFSYNSKSEDLEYFSGTASHSTVQFDGRDQMPRLSRFLFGNWLKANGLVQILTDENGQSSQASYTDSWGAKHLRKILLQENRLTVVDTVSGFSKNAVLRWRLVPAKWKHASCLCIESDYARIKIEASSPNMTIQTREGYESLHYAQKTLLPVLEITLAEPTTVTTRFSW